ncbi:MAG TPA: type II toxin-antitoxin system RelE/ParE family toxin [Gemmatimonadales bacterium]
MPTRVLVDECVPRPLQRELTAFQVRSVQEMGWAGVKNGALLYVAKFSEGIYVLHAFQKKSQKTARFELEFARSRYAAVVRSRGRR